MNIVDIVKLYFVATPVFFLIDMIWLGLIANTFYKKQLGALLATNIIWPAAIIFYLLFILGIVYFAVLPGIAEKSMGKVVFNGALFGMIAYATYDLTNLATTKNWPLTLSVVDIIWGTVLSASVALITYYIAVNILNIK